VLAQVDAHASVTASNTGAVDDLDLMQKAHVCAHVARMHMSYVLSVVPGGARACGCRALAAVSCGR
jgi:hypothetical protein